MMVEKRQDDKLKTKEVNLCTICGYDLKYIKQYKKYYCNKCGIYTI